MVLKIKLSKVFIETNDRLWLLDLLANILILLQKMKQFYSPASFNNHYILKLSNKNTKLHGC